jgi:membrane protease YdiL (CAAX protease family)
MPNIGPAQILLTLLVFTLLATVSSMFMAWGWLIWRLLTRQPILPEQPIVTRRDPTWGVWSVLLIVVVYSVVGITLSNGYALATGRVRWRQTPPAIKNDLAAVAGEKQPNVHPDANEPKFAFTEMMFINAIAQGVLLVLVPLVLRLTSGARLRDLGLSWSEWWRQVAVGVVAMLITTPVVFLIQFGAISVWQPHSHPLEKMLREHFSVDVGYLAIVTGVILAPMLEEMTFRAIFQSWLMKWMRRREHSTKLHDIPLELQGPEPGGYSLSPPPAYWEAGVRPDDFQGDPVLDQAPQSHSAVWKAIVVTSIFFAAVHAPQWPAPIPIFVLSLVLGTVYYRTGSLIASVCMHGAFNGLSTLLMFVMLLVGPDLDKKKLLPEAMHAILTAMDDVKQHDVHASKLSSPF